MYNCKQCSKSFIKRHSYIGHMKIHSSKFLKNQHERVEQRKIKRLDNRILFCPYCNIFLENKNSGGHITSCKLNPKYNEILKSRIEHGKKRKYKHSEETKKKISFNKINFLLNNPDRVPYIINHSSKPSFPEIVFETALDENNIIGWIKNYRINLYSYDFAFVDLKIDVEIDGSTHKQEKVKKIDERRDKFSIENGWIVIRFETAVVKKNIFRCIKILEQIINERKTNINSTSRVLKYNMSL